jgi:hypothetical protein
VPAYVAARPRASRVVPRPTRAAVATAMVPQRDACLDRRATEQPFPPKQTIHLSFRVSTEITASDHLRRPNVPAWLKHSAAISTSCSDRAILRHQPAPCRSRALPLNVKVPMLEVLQFACSACLTR